jgi:Adenylate cyclase associated (CAP) C terminal
VALLRKTLMDISKQVSFFVLFNIRSTTFSKHKGTSLIIYRISIWNHTKGFIHIFSLTGGCWAAQLYLSKDALGAGITTAKSSEVNVIIPGASPDDDFVEHPIPEQFVTTYSNGKWTTTTVSHSGG